MLDLKPDAGSFEDNELLAGEHFGSWTRIWFYPSSIKIQGLSIRLQYQLDEKEERPREEHQVF